MSEWKSWRTRIERDWRDAGGPDIDFTALATSAAEFAEMIVECATAPVAAFLAGLPRTLDLGACTEPRRWAKANDWEDDA
jgi:hypothetical protein